MQLNHKTIFITGASSGIGRALAEELSRYPVNLLLGMRDVKKFEALPGKAALSAKPVHFDLASQASIDKCFAAAKADFQKVDILINNAGQFVAGPVQDLDMNAVYPMFQVNLVGLTHVTAKFLQVMLARGSGKIVNNASIAGYAYFPKNSTYSATKAGVVAFSESLRRELEGSNVSVLHLVTPGVQTRMTGQIEATYAKTGKQPNLKSIPPAVWAKKVARAIEADKTILSPGGAVGLSKILAHGPPMLMDIISRKIFN
ncbi:MAG: SDR family NAD(P)-dependent oxidoreductase [Candidatus Saccharimonadales bacterium]